MQQRPSHQSNASYVKTNRLINLTLPITRRKQPPHHNRQTFGDCDAEVVRLPPITVDRPNAKLYTYDAPRPKGQKLGVLRPTETV